MEHPVKTSELHFPVFQLLICVTTGVNSFDLNIYLFCIQRAKAFKLLIYVHRNIYVSNKRFPKEAFSQTLMGKKHRRGLNWTSVIFNLSFVLVSVQSSVSYNRKSVVLNLTLKVRRRRPSDFVRINVKEDARGSKEHRGAEK